MDWRSVQFDWNQARAFLVTAEEGSLSAAARALGLAQPTLGRQVKALEQALDVVLFERSGRGLSLTPSGLELVDHVRAMGKAATDVSLAASGRSQKVEGTVSISASEVTAAFLLPPVLTQLRREHPGISVEIVSTNSISDLRRREADIAIRSVRPTDPSLVARKMSAGTARLYATSEYIARNGPFSSLAELAKADFVGFVENEPLEQGLNAIGLQVTSDSFVMLSNDHLVQWSLVRSGAGVGVMLTQVGDIEPDVEQVAPWLDPFEFEVWLVAHRELVTSRRMRLVFDWLAKELINAPER